MTSSDSSSDSFVPVEQTPLQIIDEEKVFNQDILQYINKATTSSVANNYHIISVFGSQSTGKSTLLNALFNTSFDTMNETKRQQTTRGIWLAHSPLVTTTAEKRPKNTSEIFVLDVEGTDGRERGEDQDFERKAALFALLTSEILIINIWETQIGLYQGANMGLLKTVFEVNLSLFGKSKLTLNSTHKVLLLFVIRDHVGVTPISALAETLKQDLVTMWDSLNKPADVAHFTFDDFFDINFHALHHKVLQNDLFLQDVASLGDRLVINNELWSPNYHHNIPIDGWTMYADSCWEQINNNKDLDLPTQQILVAKFKCDEILLETFADFSAKFDEIALNHKPSSETDYLEFGKFLNDLSEDVLENYDFDASKYDKTVYQERREILQGKVLVKLYDLVESHLNFIIRSKLTAFSSDIKQLKGKDFKNQVDVLSQDLITDFTSKAKLITGNTSFEVFSNKLVQEMADLITNQQVYELNNIVEKSGKRLSTNLNKAITAELQNPSEKTWDSVLKKFRELTNTFLESYYVDENVYDFGLGTSPVDNLDVISKYKFKSWVLFHDTIHKLISKDNVLTLLKDRFDDKFRYDETGLPRLYQNTFELETEFEKSKNYALEIVPILTNTKLSDDSQIVPDFDIFDKKLRAKYLAIKEEDDEDEDEDDEDAILKFDQILSEEDKANTLAKFKKQTDAQFIETKRSIIQHVTQIPYYIYLVILVLGWNEFMAILRNPFFFSLLIILGAGVYALYVTNLLAPAMAIVQRLIEDSAAIAKEKAREFLLDNPAGHGHNLRKISKPVGTKDYDKDLNDN